MAKSSGLINERYSNMRAMLAIIQESKMGFGGFRIFLSICS